MLVKIKGQTFDVDEHVAVRTEELRVGDAVKVLRRGYGNVFTVHRGVVISFDPFEMLPTVNVAYFEQEYNSATLKVVAMNEKTENVEIVKAAKDDLSAYTPEDTLNILTSKVEKAREALREAEEQLRFYQKKIGEAWAAPLHHPEM